jgi:cell envelope opacity-associated protein A
MDTQFTVTYQITDSFTGKSFTTNEEYQARYHYEKGDHVTEDHVTITLSPPFNRTAVRVSTIWHDKDHENNNEPEIN